MTIRQVYVTERKRIEPISVVYGSDRNQIRLEIMDFELPSGAAATAYAVADDPSATVYKTDCEISGNTLTFLPPEGFFQPGRNRLQVEITKLNGSLITFLIDVLCDGRLSRQGASDKPETVQDDIREYVNEFLTKNPPSGLVATNTKAGYVPTANGDDTWDWAALPKQDVSHDEFLSLSQKVNAIKLTTDAIPKAQEELRKEISRKVAIQQSAADAGKVLGIGADGRVAPVPAPSGGGTAQVPENVVLFEETTDSEDDYTVESLMLNKLKLESDGEFLILSFGSAELSRVPLPSGGGGGSGSGTVYCTGVYIGGGNLILDVDSTEAHTISATVEPADCTQILRWSSDNKDAVTVDSSGNLTIVGEGSAIITATCGSFSDSITVTVMNYYLDNVEFRAGFAINTGAADWARYSQNTRGYAHLAGNVDTPIPITALKTYEIKWDDITVDYPDLRNICINAVAFSGTTRVTTYGWKGIDDSSGIESNSFRFTAGANVDGLTFNILISITDGSETVVSTYMDWIRAHVRVKEVR